MDPEPELKSCGVLIVRGDPVQSFLLMQHPDRWDLPKGHVDRGETDLDCAFRELEEETGILRDAVQLDPEFEFVHHYYVQSARTAGQRKLKVLKIYLGRLLKDVNLQLTEHQGAKWFDWDPPHAIQERTIDPLLRQLEHHLAHR